MNQEIPKGTYTVAIRETSSSGLAVGGEKPTPDGPGCASSHCSVTPECRCGLQMSRNPHPDAGKVPALLSVGASFVCVPCTVASLHRSETRRKELRHDVRQLWQDSISGQVQDRLKKVLDADSMR